MKRKLAVLVLLFPVLAYATIFTNKFTNGVFTVYFPGKVEETTSHSTTSDGKVPLTTHIYYAVDDQHNETYLAMYIDFDADVQYDFDRGLNSSKSAMFTTVTSDDRANSNLRGLPARYALFSGSDKDGPLYVYTKVATAGPRRVYAIMVSARHELNMPRYNEFAESFKPE